MVYFDRRNHKDLKILVSHNCLNDPKLLSLSEGQTKSETLSVMRIAS